MKMFISISAISMAMIFSVHSADVVKMWYAGKPDISKDNAGFPEIKDIVHAPVFLADESRGGYNHHSKLIYFNKKFYAMWSNQRYGEDGPGQRVLYATSPDGIKWSKPKEMFAAPVPEAPWGMKGVHLAANRWRVWHGRLFAGAWCGGIESFRDMDDTERVAKRDRKHEFAVFKFYGIIYREVKTDGSLGKVFTFMKEKPKDLLYDFADGAKVVPGFVPIEKPDYGKERANRKLCESTEYKAADGKRVALFRDGKYSHRMYVSFSNDGKKWSLPKPTDIPDSPSESRAMNLSDGTTLLVGNQMAGAFDNPQKRHYGRTPLMVSVSKDGYKFDRAYAIRSGKQEFTIPRRVVRGRGGGGQYPYPICVGDKVYVMYSMGKEDIWVSSFPLKSIGLK